MSSRAADGLGVPLDLAGAELRWWPQLLAADQAAAVMAALLAQLTWQQQAIKMFGREIPEPRLVAWHGDPGAVYRYSGRSNVPAPWTGALLELRERIEALTGQRCNSVLANLYRTGADHMGWHADDEPELGVAPVIVSLSLGGVRRMQFRRRPRGPIALDLALPSGSLLLMAGATQSLYHHRIVKTTRLVPARINLTFRSVHRATG